MNSNEEYLDSLLKAVTNGQGLETDIDVSEKKAENDIESEFILDAPEWDDEEESSASMLDAIADLDNLIAENEIQENISEEEKAFSDPGALFFEGEEETEDDLFIDDIGESVQPTDESVSEVTDVEDILFSDESLSEAGEEIQEETAIKSGEDTDEKILEDSTSEAENESAKMSDEELALEEIGDLELLENIGDIDLLEDIGEGGTREENEDELEDLILAADSTEEVMEEDLMAGDADEVGFQEISDLLANPGDSDEEMLAMLGGVADEEPGDIGFFDDDLEDTKAAEEEQAVLEEESTGKKKKAKKEKKSKKSKKSDEADRTEDTGEDQEENADGQVKKQGVFARFMNFLLEEDEENEAQSAEDQEADIDELLMGEATDENAAILAELDKENEEKKPGKKEKKKGKKGKKGKDKEASGEEGEEGEEGAEEKGKKAKKEKKKKEKKEKENLEPEKPGKKVSPKKIQATALFCLTVTAAIILVVHLIPPSLEKEKARDAFYDKDYVKVVEGFYGEKLSESDELMYQRSVTILKFKRKVDAYNNYMYMGKETEALNQLIEAINRYEEIYDDAVKYNVIGEIDSMYQTVLDALQNRYGLSISHALEIYAIEDDFEYTLMLESIIDGVEYKMPESVEVNPEASVEGQPEMLPETPANEQSEMPEGTPTE